MECNRHDSMVCQLALPVGGAFDRAQQLPAGCCDFGNGTIERFLVGLRRFMKPADLSHKLQRGRVQFLIRGRLSGLS
jgi:hypothetical protein